MTPPSRRCQHHMGPSTASRKFAGQCRSELNIPRGFPHSARRLPSAGRPRADTPARRAAPASTKIASRARPHRGTPSPPAGRGRPPPGRRPQSTAPGNGGTRRPPQATSSGTRPVALDAAAPDSLAHRRARAGPRACRTPSRSAAPVEPVACSPPPRRPAARCSAPNRTVKPVATTRPPVRRKTAVRTLVVRDVYGHAR